MPIYEFYCPDCNTIFNFFSKSVNTEKRPVCPRCKKRKLDRMMSVFSTVSGKEEKGESDIDFPLDEAQMEKAMNFLAHEAERIDEDDPRQAANLMRKFSDMTGIQLSDGMEEALSRLEAGEDPDMIEAEISDLLESEDSFTLNKKKRKGYHRATPSTDDTLYEL
nr:zinc ribbon domain-containing protein [Desulfobacterales bacterium]